MVGTSGTRPATWNPISGCSPISPGCDNCYARMMANRLKGRFGYPKDDPFRVTVHWDKLYQPDHWRKSRTVFVVSMGDVAHPDVPDVIVNHCTRQAALCWPKHTFLVLTKRPERLRDLWVDRIPVPNLWVGVTAENQEQADLRIPILLQVPAAIRYVSVEPCLGPVDLGRSIFGPDGVPDHGMNAINFVDGLGYGIDWVIAGGETTRSARPSHESWYTRLRDDCREAGVPFFFKRWGEWIPGQTTLGSGLFVWDDGESSNEYYVRRGHDMHFMERVRPYHRQYEEDRMLEGEIIQEWPTVE